MSVIHKQSHDEYILGAQVSHSPVFVHLVIILFGIVYFIHRHLDLVAVAAKHVAMGSRS